MNMKTGRKLLIGTIVFVVGMIGLLWLTIRDGQRILEPDDRQDVVYSQDSSVHENEKEGE